MPTKSTTPARVVDTEIVPASWDLARDLLDKVKLHARLSIAAQVLLGFELSRLKKELGFTHGGSRSSGNDCHLNRTWDDWCNSELGISRRTAANWIDCAEVVKTRIRKLGGEAAVLNLLDSPPIEQDDENRKLLEAAVAKVTDGETQKSILEDLKLVKAPAKLTGGANDGKKDDDEPELPASQLAFAFFEPVSRSLHGATANPDYKSFLHALPIESDGESPLSLTTLEHDLESALRDVREAKAAKKGGEA